MEYWDLIKEGIDATLPPYVTNDPKRMESVQMGLLGSLAQCWVYVDDTPSVIGFVLSRIVYDDFTDSTNLLIISIYGFKPVTGEAWVDGFETIRRFGVGKGCEKIIAYTNENKVKRIVERFGGVAEYSFVSIDL